MTEQNHEKVLWELADKIRGPSALTPETLIEACREEGIDLNLDILTSIITRFGRGEEFLPKSVAQFIAKILQPYSPSSILDPWVGLGFLAAPVKCELTPDRFKAYCRNAYYSEEVLSNLEEAKGISLELGDGLHLMCDSDESYDAIVCNPPWGMRSKDPYSIEIGEQKVTVKDDHGYLLMLEACRHLAPEGRAVFVTVNNFFFSSGRTGKARHTMARLGYRPTAAIELPAGTFAPMTNIVAHLVIVEKSDSDQLFTGRFSDKKEHQKTLLNNLLQHTSGASAELGRLTDIDSYRGFTSIELNERVRETAKRTGLLAVSFSDIVETLNSPPSTKDFDRFEDLPNTVYLPQMAAINATTSQEQLPEKLKSYFQLVVNQDVVNAEFLAGLLNTQFGQIWRDSLKTGVTIPKISKTSIERSTFYLPPKESREIQNKVVDCQHQLYRLRNEISELESRLWQKPKAVEELQADIQSLNHEDRYEDWLDSLPFPLASILWACHTDAGSMKEQYERKLHFFESLAQFLSVIFLSAFHSREGVWSEYKKSLDDTLAQGNLSLERATFGTWNKVVGFFGKKLRRLLSNEPELIYNLFMTRDTEVLKAIASKRLVSVIQETNKLRNDWAGHTGVVSERDAKSVNDQLTQHIQTVREVFGVSWTGYELLLPGTCRFRDGEFHVEAKRVMGTRTPFQTETIVVSEGMEDAQLYLKSPDEPRGLQLLPLVKVMPSPRTEDNACYFYNRIQNDGIRFLSYYFEADAEVVREFSDVEAAISGLKLNRNR